MYTLVYSTKEGGGGDDYNYNPIDTGN